MSGQDRVDSLSLQPLPVKVKLTENQKKAIREQPRSVFKVFKEAQKNEFKKPVNEIEVTPEEKEAINKDPRKAFEIINQKRKTDFKQV